MITIESISRVYSSVNHGPQRLEDSHQPAVWSVTDACLKCWSNNNNCVIPYEWSVCDSPSSSPPLSAPAHQPCADPRPERESCNQSGAPFHEFMRKRGDQQKRRSGERTTEEAGRVCCITGLSVWFPVSNQPAQLLREAETPRMQCCQQNLIVPAESERRTRGGVQLCVGKQRRCLSLINTGKQLTSEGWGHWRQPAGRKEVHAGKMTNQYLLFGYI